MGVDVGVEDVRRTVDTSQSRHIHGRLSLFSSLPFLPSSQVLHNHPPSPILLHPSLLRRFDDRMGYDHLETTHSYCRRHQQSFDLYLTSNSPEYRYTGQQPDHIHIFQLLQLQTCSRWLPVSILSLSHAGAHTLLPQFFSARAQETPLLPCPLWLGAQVENVIRERC